MHRDGCFRLLESACSLRDDRLHSAAFDPYARAAAAAMQWPGIAATSTAGRVHPTGASTPIKPKVEMARSSMSKTSAQTWRPNERVDRRSTRCARPLPLLDKLFKKGLALLDDPIVVHPRSIVRQTHQIKTGYGEELLTTALGAPHPLPVLPRPPSGDVTRRLCLFFTPSPLLIVGPRASMAHASPVRSRSTVRT